jgi:hypothetical protein
MPLIVENGSVVPGANSYETLEAADALLLSMGNSAWDNYDDDEKTARMIKAFLIVDNPAEYLYSGQRQDVAQSGQWPRIGAKRYRGPDVPDSTIPPEVKRAQIIAAGGLADGSIIWGASATEQAVRSESLDGVGSTSYFEPGRSTATPARVGPFAFGWQVITSILAPLLDRGLYTQATVGPRYNAPSYTPPIFEIGMNDEPGGRMGGLRDDGYRS